MTKIDWRAVILKIKLERKWPMKTIAARIGVNERTLDWWKKGRHEPRYSQGVELLRLAGIDG
jgi:transcriptional regulator with XRE-family HTH domain